jgi:hypothetical protein
MHEYREDGDAFQPIDDGKRSIEGLDSLVAEIRSLVEAQRANAGADMLRSETQSALIAAVQKLASSNGAGGMSQTVLEDLVVQLGHRPDKEPNPVYVFEFERNQTTQFITKIIATPQVA